MTQNKKFILFDFDGVIADSFDTAFEVEKMICPDMTESDYRRRFEGNINDWEDPRNSHTEACRHDIDFFAEYVPKMKERVKVVPGMDKIIEDLAKLYTLIIISSTITSPIRDFIESHGMTKYFAEIMGNDIHKSKAEKIKMVFQKYDVNSPECIFITDTLGDMREAKRVGVGTIGVSWGFQDEKTLAIGNSFMIVEKPESLYSAISEYFKRQNATGVV